MKLKKSIVINGEKIEELNLSKDKFTASVIIKAEKEFLITGGVFPSGAMEDSREYLLTIASKMLDLKTEDLSENLSGEDFIEITNTIKGFFGGSVLTSLIQNFLEK